jgi:hypothetical protein
MRKQSTRYASKPALLNLLHDLDAAMSVARPDQIISVSYEIHALLFPPGEPDENARERAYNFAEQRGFVMENRIAQAHICFKKGQVAR